MMDVTINENFEVIILIIIAIIQLGHLILFEDDEVEDTDNNDIQNMANIILTAHNLRSFNRPRRIQNYIENVVWNYVGRQFQQNFRMSVEAYEELLRRIGPRLRNQGNIGRTTVCIEKQILSVIWLLATPDSYRSVGERFDLAKSSLSKCFIRVVNALCDVASNIITWPTGEELERVKRGFENMAGIPNIIGVVDGTFIVIKAPKEDPHSYITRKCNYAMTLQAVCNHELRFTDCFVGFPGSVSDTRIFKNSDIYIAVLNDHDNYFPDEEFIIGDKAYPVLTWCIPPFINRGNLTQAQRFFNVKLSQTRQTIERTFALLFGRFRRLRYLDMNKTKFIPNTVLASCVLHNICLNHEDLFVEDYIRRGLPAVANNAEIDPAYHEHQYDGRNKRSEICRRLFQNNM